MQPRRLSWLESAKCAEHGRDSEPPNRRSGREANKYAAEYCSGCPVVAECAEDALRTSDTGLVRAGIFVGGYGNVQRPAARAMLQQIVESGAEPVRLSTRGAA